ncbi:hypothetical protein C4565_08170 [Candidatus Parcubacteria bacterium]|jgi:type I restriction enzyme S subunit|nr:MAG: hypothetical protein C4565_08170 [Candidatus Parcubacteria bacterium]
MEVKKGYKQTEVGAVPNDWDVKPLGRLVSSVEYGSSTKSDTQGQIPVLRMGNLQNGKIDWTDLVYTSNEREIGKYQLRFGDVLFNRTNTIDLVGKTSIYNSERPAIFAGYLIRIKADKSLLNSRFLNYILNAQFSKNYSNKVLSVAVGQANINGRKLKTYPIPLPPTLAEQEAIAAALSDVDSLLIALDTLIVKKRLIKQGTMQELLTGKKRLPGFKGEWEVRRLGKLGSCLRGVSYKGQSDLSPNDTANTIRLLRSNNIQSAVVIFEDFQFVNSQRVSDYQIMLENDILICMANGSKDLVGKAATFHVKDHHKYTFGTFMGCFRLNTSDAAPSFVSQTFKTNLYRNYIANLIAGSSINNLKPSDIESIEIPFPSLPEQIAIAEILNDMDAEIATLEARREKTSLLKQGMMQELLTGKIRLV